MKKYEKPRITSQNRAMSVISTDNSPLSKVSIHTDNNSSNATSAGYEADE